MSTKTKADVPAVNVELAPHAPTPVSIGFTDAQSFELAQRVGKMFAASSLVPKEFQNNLGNCAIALNMAARIGADPLMVMQNLYVVHGRPGWSSQFLIATFNNNPKFSALRYEFRGDEGKDDWACRAWAIERETGERLEGAWVSIAIARREGWYERNNSKWKTMPEQMLRYRAASWFIRAYAPEIAMGLHTAEELRDSVDMYPDDDGTFTAAPTAADLNAQVMGDKPPVSGQPQKKAKQVADKKPSSFEPADTVTCPNSGKIVSTDQECPTCRDREDCPVL